MQTKTPVGIREKKLYEEKGYVKIRNVYSLKDTELIKNQVNQLWIRGIANGVIRQDPARPLTSLFPPLRNPHTTDESFLHLIIDDRAFDIAEQLLEEEALIVGCTCFFKAPGSRSLPFHQDNYDIGTSPGTTCAIWISLDNADAENGGLIIVPATHKLGLLRPNLPGHLSEYGQTVPVPEGYSSENITTSAGDIVAFSGNVLHGSGANRSTFRFRHSFVLHFTKKSTEQIYVMHDYLIARTGEVVKRKLNKKHSITRLFLENKEQ